MEIDDDGIQLDDLKKIAKYSTIDIIKALKIPRERLRDWIVRDFIRPTLPSLKQGIKAGFSRNAIYGIAIFEQLLDYGYKREAAANIVQNFMAINSPAGAMEYLIFKHMVKEGEKRIDTIITIGADINKASEIIAQQLIAAENNAEETWDSFHILNIKEVIHKVDIALMELE